jgi:hypothetical protein
MYDFFSIFFIIFINSYILYVHQIVMCSRYIHLPRTAGAHLGMKVVIRTDKTNLIF